MSEMAMIQASTVKVSDLPTAKQSSGKQSGGGDFMAVLEQMVQNGEIDPNTAAQIQEMQQNEEEEASELGMQMLMELLAGTPMGQQLLDAMTNGEMAAEAGAGAAEQGILPIPELQPQQPETLEELLAEGGETMDVEIVQPDQEQETSEMDFLMHQHKFSQSIQEAQKNLRSQPKQENLQELDIDKLQADVNVQRFAPEPVSVDTEMDFEAQTQNIIDQLDTGIKENIALGNEEFIMRLRPEGLGEITVKMIESEGRILLSILTSSSEVARALSAESAALQNTLRPLQAEIQEISAMQEYAAEQQFDFTENHFMDRRQFGGQGQSRTQTGFAGGQLGGVGEEMNPLPISWNADTGLDAYI